jgi:hypothetical protein
MDGGETMSEKLVLDACCGGRMFWFDKQNPLAVFCDNREFTDTLCDGRTFEVKPDIIADYTNLPFANGTFRLVVFDPPHLTHGGKSSWLVKKYGKLPADWQTDIKQGFDECMRVLADYGVLIFKWGEEDVSVGRILQAIGATPLFGHKSGRTSKTHWMAFMKIPEGDKANDSNYETPLRQRQEIPEYALGVVSENKGCAMAEKAAHDNHTSAVAGVRRIPQRRSGVLYKGDKGVPQK